MTMTKNTLLISFLVLAAILFALLYQANSFFKNTARSTVRQFQPAQAQILPDRKPATPAPAQNLAQKRAELRDLQLQLASAKEDLEAQNQELTTLKNRKSEQERQAAVSFTSQISANRNEIQNLSEALADQRLAEDDVNQAATAALREQNSAAQLARDQIDQNIRLQEQQIAQTTEQINYWKTYQANLAEQQTRLAGLQNQLNIQQQQLNDLRVQKVNISAAQLNQTRAIDGSVQQQQSQLVDNQDAILNQIATLRDRNLQLQTNQARVQMSFKSLDEQVNAAQKNFEAQAQSVQELEDSVQKKQQEINRLSERE